MNSNQAPQPPVIEALQRAGQLHARQRALMFLLRAMLWIGISIPVVLLSDVLVHFSEALRLSGLIAILVAVVAVMVVAVCIATVSKPPLLRIARLLESRNPALGSRLINILQLADSAQSQDNDALTRLLATEAINSAGKSLDIEALPPLAREPAIPKRIKHLAACAIIIAILSYAGGRSAKQQWLRLIDPLGDHPPFSLTQLAILKPTEAQEVEYGGFFTVEAIARGHQPAELFVTAKPLEGDGTPFTLPMHSRGDGTFLARLENIREPLELTVHTAGFKSRSHYRHLNLILTPKIKSATYEIKPPAYTRLPARSHPYRFTSIQALEGSEVTFNIVSNRPLGEGNMQLETGNEIFENHVLQPAQGGDAHQAVSKMVVKQSGRMTFMIVDVAGNQATQRPSALLTATTDLPPEITIDSPEKDAYIVESFTTPVQINASDDYGLHSMRLHIAVNDQFRDIEPLVFENPKRQHHLEHELNLAEMGVKAGDVITIFAEAVDIRPEPQMARTAIRKMVVITENDYNEYLREKADVAMIAGKYEELLNRFEEQIEQQRQITEELEKLKEEMKKNPDQQKTLNEFAKQFARQTHLNEQLKQMAEEMKEFGRDNPLYDFEKELQEKLKEQADDILKSVEQNEKESQEAAESAPAPPEAPSKETIEQMAQAAKGQLDRLAGEQQQAQEQIEEPLKELAQLHELMKDFNRFEELAEKQRDLAEKLKAYKDKDQLDPMDEMAMRQLGAEQREMAQKLEQLEKKLRHDAEAAKEKLPQAAESALELADRIKEGDMADLARKAAGNMLKADADQAHGQAKGLQELMERLFEDGQMPQQGQAANELDRMLRLNRGMNPGDSLRQMMRSRNFRPLPGAAGRDGMMDMAQAESMLLGGESLMDGDISRELSGKGDRGGPGQPGGPTAKIDRPDRANVDNQSSRRTSTPNSGSMLLEYENIADAYFRRLTIEP